MSEASRSKSSAKSGAALVGVLALAAASASLIAGLYRTARLPAPAGPGYQPDQASAKIAAGALLGVLALIALAGAAVFGMFSAFHAQLAPAPPGLETAALPRAGPRLETDPRADRIALEARERAQIEVYGWADRDHGIARIPIERAMALQAQRGWPKPEAGK